jgi:lipopolysaccharide biosynthesis glycosyltransferase
MSNQKIAICLISDLAYLDYAAFLVHRLKLLNNPLPDVFVVTTEDVDVRKFEELFAESGAKQIRFDLGDLISLGIAPQAHVSVAAYAKICISDLIPVDYDSVLYMDIDILPIRSIQPILDFYLIHPVAGTLFTNGENRKLFGSDDTTYFSSGLMLIDLLKWRDGRATKNMLELIRLNPKLTYGEQDILNLYFKDQWQLLPSSFNFMAELQLNPHFNDHSIDPIIVHLVGSRKPWTNRGHSEWHRVWRQQYSEYSDGRSVRKLEKVLSDSGLFKFLFQFSKLLRKAGLINLVPKKVLSMFHRVGEI